ncbi:MAG: helix-turn-helix domain-containing protein [Candidatus Dojkabacteria bacterium]|nr:helix-turn-helix domain-containing protein [Candidatus Dojkabacteria bacterium]
MISLELSAEHALTYTASLKIGSAPASTISKETKVPRSTTYNLLNDLSKIGLVSIVDGERKKIFTPNPPEILLDLLKQKRNELKSNIVKFESELEELSTLYKSHSPQFPKVTYFEGEKGLKTALYDTLVAETESLAICQGHETGKESIMDEPQFLADYMEQERIRKIKLRQLLQDNSVNRDYKIKTESGRNQIILIPPEPIIKIDHVDKCIYANKVSYISHDNLIAVITEDKTIANAERALFERLWRFYSKEKNTKLVNS